MKQKIKKISLLNCTEEELKRMIKRSPQTRLEWLDSAIKFAKAKKQSIKIY
jgi:hypothetical protein